MKLKIKLILFFILFWEISFGQQYQNDRHIVLLRGKSEGLHGNNCKTFFSKVADSTFNKTLQKHEIFDAIECVPDAKIDIIKDLYIVEFKGDLQEFKRKLEFIEGIAFDREFTIAEALSCPNPEPPINDTWVYYNWVNNYALNQIEANCAWSITKGSSSVVVAVIDTDFESHEDLDNKMVNVTGPVTDMVQHGLWVAGIVAAETNNNQGVGSIGYNTMVAGYRVSHTFHPAGPNGIPVAYTSGIPYQSLMQAWNDGMKIINVSWSGTGLSYTEAQAITNSGAVLVLAAGNSPSSTSHSTIADIPGVINVSGVDSDDEHGPTGHARNQWVDLCAPSLNVTTTLEGDSYGGAWGTSFAAPLVSGTIGLMIDVNPCLTPEEIEIILKSTTDPIIDASSYPGLVGTGRLNAFRAVERAGTEYIQNIEIDNNTTITKGYQILVGKEVTTETSYGDVIVDSGKNLTLKARGKIRLDKGFYMEPGSTLLIDANQNQTIICP